MSQKPPLSISFHNFGRSFGGGTGFITRTLSERFTVQVERFGADIEFYSVFGEEIPAQVLQSKALKVWLTGENYDPRHLVYDLYFGFQQNGLLGARSIRFPLWVLYIDWWSKSGPMSVEALTGARAFAPRPHFCNFIYSKDASYRAEVFHRLDKRRHVHSLGGVLNNMGGRVGDKLAALRDYRFTMAFENMLAPGYVTEKILQPLASGSIPIYWGGPEARTDFNPTAFIDASAFASADSLIDHVLALADDEEALRSYAEAPIFADGIPYHHTPAFFADRIQEALDTPSMRGIGREINAALAPRQTIKIRARSLANRVKAALR